VKTKTFPQFHVDGRRARTLRKLLDLPRNLNELDEDTTTQKTQIELALVSDALNLPRMKYDWLANPSAFLCGGALTAWIGGYPASDWDFFFPDLNAAETFHHRLLKEGFVLWSYQGVAEADPIFQAIGAGELPISGIVREVIVNEEIRALTYRKPHEKGFDYVQIVLLIQGETVQDVIDTFDFTISMLGTDGTWLYFNEYTWTDLLRKRLRVHHIHHGISTMRRMVKYSRRGFYACVGTMREIAEGVVNSPSDQPISID
jgi:hypothetical protein